MSILSLQINNPNILGPNAKPVEESEVSGNKGPQAHECVLMLVAEMMAKHDKADKNMQLSPEQTLSQYIEEAIASAIQQAEQQAMSSGSLQGSFSALKEFLDQLAASAGGISDASLKNYILTAAHNMNAYKDDPNILKELSKMKSDLAKYQRYQEKYEHYKHKHNPFKMAYYKILELKLAGTSNYHNAEGKFNKGIEEAKSALEAKDRDFLMEIGNNASITGQQAARKIEMSETDIKDQQNDSKAELGIINAFASVIGSNRI